MYEPGEVLIVQDENSLMYGILENNETIIIQKVHQNLNVREISIERFPISSFGEGTEINVFSEIVHDRAFTYGRAISNLGHHKYFGSVYGDDFVFWCVFGELPYAQESKYFGEQISVPFNDLGVMKARHHGIVIEENSVVHFGPDDNYEGSIALNAPKSIHISPMGNFLKGRQFIPHPYKEKKCFSKLETRNRAINSISLSEKTFNLLFSNCEHWATWCKTGKSKSTQIKSVMLESAIGIGLSIAGNPRAGAFLLSRSFRKHTRF